VIRYAVLNPMSGEYTKVNSEQEAQKLAVQNIIDFYKSHTHSQLYQQIEVDEQGNETWKYENNGTELPIEYLEQIKSAL
jgi:hypothetical protein